MPKYIVTLIRTENVEIIVDAPSETEAYDLALTKINDGEGEVVYENTNLLQAVDLALTKIYENTNLLQAVEKLR